MYVQVWVVTRSDRQVDEGIWATETFANTSISF
jgi:hypothetical protein